MEGKWEPETVPLRNSSIKEVVSSMKQSLWLSVSGVAALALVPSLFGQNGSNSGNGPGVLLQGITAPYRQGELPPVHLGNSSRLDQVTRAGSVYLSLADAIALALENNLDIEVQRYSTRIAQTDLQRANAGGFVRGLGLGVSTTTTGGQAGGGQALVGTVQQLVTATGTAIPSLDAVMTSTIQWGHRTVPQTSPFVTGNNSLVTESTLANFAISRSFLTGTSVTFGYNNNLQSQNSGRNDFNPSTNSYAQLQIVQPLLQSFGRDVNSRNIRIARNNIHASDLVFRQQVITTVSQVIALYWDLVSFSEDVKVRKQALELNQKLYNDNRKQVEIGTLAPIEIIRAEAEVARSQQDLLVAETQVLQQETILKNALSRTGVMDSVLASSRLIPTDSIKMPEIEPVEPLQDLIQRALDSRPEVQQSRINIENSKIALVGVKNALLPSINAYADLRNNGLAGQLNTLPIPPIPGQAGAAIARNPAAVDKFFLGGYGTVFGQLLSRNFPDYAVGVQLSVPLRNRAAQADVAREQLNLRQSELRLQAQINQIRVDVQNSLIGLQQARARFQTATKTRVLQEQTLDAEQKKYQLGASTIFFVIQAQRDLAQAQASEVAALTAYARAKVDLDRATGVTIESNSIEIDEAVHGTVTRQPSLPVLKQ